MSKFIFKSYNFDIKESVANFNYAFDDGRSFKETIKFEHNIEFDSEVLDRALFLAFILIGTSYYKTFPVVDVEMEILIDDWQVEFFNKVYQEGLAQFAFENNLKREDLAHFKATSLISVGDPLLYEGTGILVLQSGGKDSLLTASLLQRNEILFTSWFLASGESHPTVIDKIGEKLEISLRSIDNEGLKKALEDGGKNGHVPITYIVKSIAVIQAILLGKSHILTSIAHEGEEPNYLIDNLVVSHQWSKTWQAEVDFIEYIDRYVSPNIRIGSPIRSYSELRVAELFVTNCWEKYGYDFSSCNIANYKQGNDNSNLKWCGDCPKCANSYLLFAPFLPSDELKKLFNGEDLFTRSSLNLIFKGLLGIDGEPKPFECIGEIEELRLAYHKAQNKGGYESLPFEVPESTFDYMQTYQNQEWAIKMLQ